MRKVQKGLSIIRGLRKKIDKTLKSAEVILAQFDLSRQAETKIEDYIGAIDQLRNNIRYFSSNNNFRSSDGVLNQANTLPAKAISNQEDDFKQLLNSYRITWKPGDAGGKDTSHNHSEHQNNDLETAVYTPSTVLPPRIMPLLHDLAQQMVQAGHQQQLLVIYKETRSLVLEESIPKLGVENLAKQRGCPEDAMGGFGGKDRKLDSFHSYYCK